MKKNYLLGLLSGLILSTVFTVFAAQIDTTIESCGLLLPEGSTYNLEITGTINRFQGSVLQNGNLKLTDNAQGDQVLTEEQLAPFLDCAVPLFQ